MLQTAFLKESVGELFPWVTFLSVVSDVSSLQWLGIRPVKTSPKISFGHLIKYRGTLEKNTKNRNLTFLTQSM